MLARHLVAKLVLIVSLSLIPCHIFADGHRVHFTYGGGLDRYRMGDINERYIGGFARPLRLLEDDLATGGHFRATIEYQLTPKWSLVGGCEYLFVSSLDTILNTDASSHGAALGTYGVRLALSANGIAPLVGARWTVLMNPIDVRIGADLSFLFGTVTLKTKSRSLSSATTRRALGIGMTPGVALDLPLSQDLSLEFSGGYRFHFAGELKDKAGHPWIVSTDPSGRPLELDFSGSFITTSIRVGL